MPTGDWLTDLVARVHADAADVVFDAAAHRFTSRRTGRELPGVTRVMREQGFIDDSFYTSGSSARGTFVHEATLLIDADDLEDASVPHEYRGYCESYAAAIAELQPVTLLAEQIVVDHVLGYAGITDRLWLVRDELAVVDFKAGARARWHGVQLSGYKRAILGSFKPPRTVHRRALYLYADGRPGTLVRYADSRDDHFFLAAVTCSTYRSEFR
jgi:hypothetical protein